jgi:NAD(P)-dependent dehydrogenase (short-subunit alcohol dehydrogenase family)
MVEELLARGATKVYATSRSPQPRTEGRIVPLVLDVTDDDAVAAAAQGRPTSQTSSAMPVAARDSRT